MADFDTVNDSMFDEAYEILNQENQETIEAYRNNSPTQEQIDHLQQVVNVMRSLGGDIEQSLNNQQQSMDETLRTLRNVTGVTRDADSEAHDLEEEWENFVRSVEQEFEIAKGKKQSRTDKIGDRLSGFIRSEEEKDDSESDILYAPDSLKTKLKGIEKKFLNPLLRDEEEKTSQQEAFKEMNQVLETSVELHQEANKYKMILLRAKRDVGLQQQLADHSSIHWFNDEVMEVGNQEQRLEREVEDIMQAEEELVNSFDEAGQLLKQILELDEDIMDTISLQARRKSRTEKVIGSLGSSNNTVVDMLRFIDSVHTEHDYGSIADYIESEFRPKITKIERMEDTDMRRERRLAEEVEEYVEEHRRLFNENKEEVEEAERNLTPEGPVEDVRNGAPPGTREFVNKIKELRDLMNQPILGDLRDAEQHYRRVYRIDNDEIENVEDFNERAQTLSNKLEILEEEFIDKTPFKNAFEAQEGSNRLHMQMEKFMNGEHPFRVGFRQVADSIEQLQADLEKIYMDEHKEKNHFIEAHEDLESEIVRVDEILTDLDQLESMVENFRDPENPRNTVNGESHPYRAYHDAFIVASKQLFGGADKESQLELHNLLKNIVEWVEELEEELERIEEVQGEIINHEHVEEGELQREIDYMDAMREQLEEAFQGDISTAIPNPVSNKLDQIDDAIENIEERLRDLENRKESEEDELKSGFEQLEDLEQKASEADREGSEIVEETADMFESEETDDEFGFQ